MTTNTSDHVKVTRDGTVTRNGQVIGRVVKEMRQGLWVGLMGANYSATGTPWWTPYDAEGTKLSDGYDTRKRAVALVDKVTAPTSVTDIKLEYGLGYTVQCVTASVRYKGHYMSVSRYAAESAWVVDFYMTPESFMPVFAHGTGTRVTRATVLTGELAELTTAAAEAAGLWPMV